MNCQRFGHTIKKCYSKGGGLEGQGLKRDEKAKVMIKAPDTRMTELFMAIVSDNGDSDQHVELHVANRLVSPRGRQTWIVDSGASAHMALQRDWFKTY